MLRMGALSLGRGLFVGDARLHVHHLVLGQPAAAHGQQRADPAQDGQAVAQEHGHVKDAGGRGIAGLGHGGGVADEGHAACGDGGGEGGDDLVHQAVGAADHGGDIFAAAVQLVVDDVRHEARVGGGDAHGKAVGDEGEQHKQDHGHAHVGDGLGAHGVAHDHEEGDDHQVGKDAVARPRHDGFLVAVLAGVARAVGRKQDGRQHADHAEGGGQAHVADQDAVEHGADDGGRGSLLGDLVGGGGENIALQGLVVPQHVHHVPHLQPLVLDTLEVFGLVIRRYADAHQHHADEGDGHAQPGGDIQKFLVEAAAQSRHQLGVDHDVQRHGGQVVQHRLPYAHGGPLLGIVGHQRRQGLDRHVHDGVADDVQKIEPQEGRDAVPLAGEEVEHAQQTY